MSLFPAFHKSTDQLNKGILRLILYKRPNHVRVDKVESGSASTNDKWNHLKHELFCSVFQGKRGCLVTACRHSFEMNVPKWDTVIEKRVKYDDPTYLLPKQTWTREELWKLTTSENFDWEDIWMSPNLDAKQVLNMTKQDVDRFWNFLFISNFNTKYLIKGIEVMGGLPDGDGIIWHNPSFPKVDSILHDFKILAGKLEVQIEEA